MTGPKILKAPKFPELTPEQLKALREYANKYGRNWKSKLRDSWMSGFYDDGDDSSSLQQIRNTHGPAWLARFYHSGIALRSGLPSGGDA